MDKNPNTKPAVVLPHDPRLALALAGLVLVVLTLVKHLHGLLGDVGYTLAAVLQLYLPFVIIWRRNCAAEAIGLTLTNWQQEAKTVALLCLIAFPLFFLGHHYFQEMFVGRSFAWRWPDNLLYNSFTHFVAIALPEEVFYRGYLQPNLTAWWPDRWNFLGAPLGFAVVVTSALFALGHFLGEYNLFRLGPFFPGLIFGWLRNRQNSILGAIAFHGLCNIAGEIAFACYHG